LATAVNHNNGLPLSAPYCGRQ